MSGFDFVLGFVLFLFCFDEKKPCVAKVSVLGITGIARKGKSYLLSRALGDPKAFELGHSVGK
jgi:hypothetical protein